MECHALLPYLPEEVVLDILCRLPVKSLVRFRCVCRHWRSLLTDDYEFVMRYHCLYPHRYAYLLKCSISEHESSSAFPFHHDFIVIPEDEFDIRVKVKPPLPQHYERTESAVVDSDAFFSPTVVGSIDGVFCLIYNTTYFILWNPATRDYYNAPCPNIDAGEVNKAIYGFACDGFGTYFSIVRAVRKNCRHHWRKGDPYCCKPEVLAELYDSKSDLWTDISSPPKSLLLCVDDCCTIVCGTPYWCTFTWSASIISFNPSLRRFSEFEGPGSIAENKCLAWSLGEISGSLVAFAQRADKGVDVWQMVRNGDGADKVSWTKVFSFAPLNGVVKWLKCWGNCELLVASVSDYPHGLVTKTSVYSPRTKKTRLLTEIPAARCNFPEVFVYVESLVSPVHRIYGACVSNI